MRSSTLAWVAIIFTLFVGLMVLVANADANGGHDKPSCPDGYTEAGYTGKVLVCTKETVKTVTVVKEVPGQERVVEVIKEVPVEVIKEVPVEVVVTKTVPGPTKTKIVVRYKTKVKKVVKWKTRTIFVHCPVRGSG